MVVPEHFSELLFAANSAANRLQYVAPHSESEAAAVAAAVVDDSQHAALGVEMDSEWDSVFAASRLQHAATFSESAAAAATFSESAVAAAVGESKHASLGLETDSESVFATSCLQNAATFSESVAVAAVAESKLCVPAQVSDSELKAPLLPV